MNFCGKFSVRCVTTSCTHMISKCQEQQVHHLLSRRFLQMTQNLMKRLRRELLQLGYVNPQTPIDWTTESQKIRDPKNLFTTPSSDPIT